MIRQSGGKRSAGVRRVRLAASGVLGGPRLGVCVTTHADVPRRTPRRLQRRRNPSRYPALGDDREPVGFGPTLM